MAVWVITNIFTACGHTQWGISKAFEREERETPGPSDLPRHAALSHPAWLLSLMETVARRCSCHFLNAMFSAAECPLHVELIFLMASAVLCNRIFKNKINAGSDVRGVEHTLRLHPPLLFQHPRCLWCFYSSFRRPRLQLISTVIKYESNLVWLSLRGWADSWTLDSRVLWSPEKVRTDLVMESCPASVCHLVLERRGFLQLLSDTGWGL